MHNMWSCSKFHRIIIPRGIHYKMCNKNKWKADKIHTTERESGSSNAPAVSGSLQTSDHQHMGMPGGHLGSGDKGPSQVIWAVVTKGLHKKLHSPNWSSSSAESCIPHYLPSNFLCDLCHQRCFVHHCTTCYQWLPPDLVALFPGSRVGKEREPGTHCWHMCQVPLVTCILLRYTKITVNSVYLVKGRTAWLYSLWDSYGRFLS